MILTTLFALTLAHAGDYLPLQPGDTLQYQDRSGATLTTEITRTYAQHWRQHDSFAGIGPQWIRSAPGTTQYRVYANTTGEQVFFDSAAPVGTTWRADLGSCNSGPITLRARNLSVTTPAGTFDDVLQLALQPSCADGGLTELLLAPGVGVVQWTHDTIAGPQTWQVARGTVGDVVLPRPFGLQIAGSFEHAEVWYDMMPPLPPGGPDPIPLRAALSIKNGTPWDETWRFTSSQRFDIHILDSAGTIVKSWSDNRAFLTVLGQLTLQPGESVGYDGVIELTDRTGAPLPAGEYTVRMELANSGSGQPAAESSLFVGWAF